MYKYGTLAAATPVTIKVADDNGTPSTPITSVINSWQVEAGADDVLVESRLVGMTAFVEQTTVLGGTTIILDLCYVADFRVSSAAGGEFSIGNFVSGR